MTLLYTRTTVYLQTYGVTAWNYCYLVHRNHLRGSKEIIQYGLSFYPEPVRRLLTSSRGCHIAAGVDPGFVGLHEFDSNGGASFGREYKDTPHVCYPCHLKYKTNTSVMVLPSSWDFRVDTVVHEFAHVIDGMLGCISGSVRLTATNDYAGSTRGEAFAEAMCLYMAPAAYQETEEVWARNGLGWDNVRDLNRSDMAFLDHCLELVASF